MGRGVEHRPGQRVFTASLDGGAVSQEAMAVTVHRHGVDQRWMAGRQRAGLAENPSTARKAARHA